MVLEDNNGVVNCGKDENVSGDENERQNNDNVNNDNANNDPVEDQPRNNEEQPRNNEDQPVLPNDETDTESNIQEDSEEDGVDSNSEESIDDDVHSPNCISPVPTEIQCINAGGEHPRILNSIIAPDNLFDKEDITRANNSLRQQQPPRGYSLMHIFAMYMQTGDISTATQEQRDIVFQRGAEWNQRIPGLFIPGTVNNVINRNNNRSNNSNSSDSNNMGGDGKKGDAGSM